MIRERKKLVDVGNLNIKDCFLNGIANFSSPKINKDINHGKTTEL
jgi:hypothetical protein